MENKTLVYVLYAVVILALAYFVYITQGFGIWASTDAKVNTDGYQAIFLENNQVYFGKISHMDAKKVILEDIYYLQVQQVQPKPENQSEDQLTLVKLGNEIHAPEDKMIINPDKIMFWENLQDDGKVVQAIKTYQSEGDNQVQNNAPSVNAPAQQ
jgi:hypothetical protein